MAKDKKTDKLAYEAAQARTAGMSYGKWKAAQKHEYAKQETVQQPPVMRRTCVVCEKVFEQYDKRQRKYCSIYCKREADYARERAERAEARQRREQLRGRAI